MEKTFKIEKLAFMLAYYTVIQTSTELNKRFHLGGI